MSTNGTSNGTSNSTSHTTTNGTTKGTSNGSNGHTNGTSQPNPTAHRSTQSGSVPSFQQSFPGMGSGSVVSGHAANAGGSGANGNGNGNGVNGHKGLDGR